ncbi:MAG: histidine phosphatase family protein, partial [Chloroflexi bacterium]|nr:histidine phosphatase family protein [Chloroflexota bacterium]
NEPVDVLYASPMLRARQTAEVIGARLGLPVIVQPGFEEADQPY